MERKEIINSSKMFESNRFANKRSNNATQIFDQIHKTPFYLSYFIGRKLHRMIHGLNKFKLTPLHPSQL